MPPSQPMVAGFRVVFSFMNSGIEGRMSTAVRQTRFVGVARLVALGALLAVSLSSVSQDRWCDSSEDSLINPVGRWQGVEEIMGFYRHEMGENYSSRNLKTTDIDIRVYTDAAWAEFSWNFEATRKKDGSAVSFRGMETQIYQKKLDSWCLVHVHYSSLPAENKAATE
jgi:ketosteroid isomerase-like protein